MSAARDIIARLGLQPHPEGGWFRETWRDSPAGGGRGAGTAIYYLLAAGEESRWHRVDSTEIWHFYAGDPLTLAVAAPGVAGEALPVARLVLGTDLAAGQQPQAVVPAGAWQSARPMGGWTLVGCTVAPAFRFAGFEMAPEGWTPDLP